MNDVNILCECGFLKGYVHYLYKKYKKVLLELNEGYLNHTKDEEESIIEKILNK